MKKALNGYLHWQIHPTFQCVHNSLSRFEVGLLYRLYLFRILVQYETILLGLKDLLL